MVSVDIDRVAVPVVRENRKSLSAVSHFVIHTTFGLVNSKTHETVIVLQSYTRLSFVTAVLQSAIYAQVLKFFSFFRNYVSYKKSIAESRERRWH